MATREEIREGLADKLFTLSGGKMYSEYTDEILSYLHSQGIVIKVDEKELKAGETYMAYLVEPLISPQSEI